MKRYLITLSSLMLAVSSLSAQGLSKAQSQEEQKRIVAQWSQEMKSQTDYITQSKVVVRDTLKMPIAWKVFGEKPDDGYSLFISLHGGGNTLHSINDSQWQNQTVLYQPAEGVYLCPRAPYDDWDMHFKPALDGFYQDIIHYACTHLEVNPDKVYVMGYSAGGDGVWRLAPRMADTWAAASMMAGHPGDVSLLNLRNLPFMVWCGGQDAAYDRNNKCAERIVELDSLRKADPTGYIHEGHIVKGKPHWMDQVDTVAVSWMAQYIRNPYPTKIVWRQEEVMHPHFYWLSVPKKEMARGKEVRLSVKGNNIYLEHCDYNELTFCLNDQIVNLDKPVSVYLGKKRIAKQKVLREKATLERTIRERGDTRYVFPATLTIHLDGKK